MQAGIECRQTIPPDAPIQEGQLPEVVLMSSSGIRLRISLIVATTIVLANMVLVLNGSSTGFYAGLSKTLVPDTPLVTTLVAQTVSPGKGSRDTFAAFETRAHHSPDVY
jgi:hypothetical protein